MKKIFIILTLLLFFITPIHAYVDFTDLGQDGSYTFADDFSDVKLKKNYVVWETDRELAIVTSDSDIYIYEHALTYYLGCKKSNCSEVIAYKYQKDSKGQFKYLSKSDRYAIKYTSSNAIMQKVWSSTESINYKEIFTNLKTYYSNKPINESYLNFNFPKKELPSKYYNKLANKGDIIQDIANGFDKVFGGLGNWFNKLFGILGDIKDTIISLPQRIIDGILDGLKALFIPSDGYFENKFNNLNNRILNTFNLNIDSLNVFNSGQKNFDGFNFNYMGQQFSIIDNNLMNQALSILRPVLQGFFGFLIIMYNINQFMSTFKLGKVGGNSDDN